MLSEKMRQDIENEIKSNPIVIYMKGTPDAPQCGFSARSVEILRSYNLPIKSHDILAGEELRQGIKEFTDWPTIPQIFIKGQFVGGCDIITEMHENGELAKLLGL